MDVSQGNLEELLKAFCTSDDKKNLETNKIFGKYQSIYLTKLKQNKM